MIPALFTRIGSGRPCRQETCGERIDRGRIAQVEAVELDTGDAGERCARFLGCARGNDDRDASVRERSGSFQADTPVPASDHGDGSVVPGVADDLARGRDCTITGMDRRLLCSHVE